MLFFLLLLTSPLDKIKTQLSTESKFIVAMGHSICLQSSIFFLKLIFIYLKHRVSGNRQNPPSTRPLTKHLQQLGLDQAKAQEPENSFRSPMWVQGPQAVSRMRISKAWEVEAGLNPRYSNMGCGYSKWAFTHCTPWPVLVS